MGAFVINKFWIRLGLPIAALVVLGVWLLDERQVDSIAVNSQDVQVAENPITNGQQGIDKLSGVKA